MTEKKTDARVTFVKEDYARRAAARMNLERSWLLDINFYVGNQYAEILPTGGVSETAKRYYWQENRVFNHIAPIIESRLAKFNSIKAEAAVRPASDEADDVSAAKFSTRLLKSVREENNMSELMREAAFWAELTGTAFYKIYWDKNKGRIISEEQNLSEGDVGIEVCPPYEIYPDDLACGSVEKCRSIIRAKAYPVESVEEAWNVKIGDAGKTGVMKYGALSGGGVCGSEEDGYCLVLERYSLPAPGYPDGRLLIVCGDKVLYDGALPYENGVGGKRGYPFVRQVAFPRPGAFFGTSLIERMIPVQRAYNEIKNRKHEFFKRMTAGVLVAEDGSVDADNLDEEGIGPGKVILYRQGCSEPKMLNFGSVPSEFGEEEDRLLKEFVSVSGVSDYLLNGTFGGTTLSGTALNLILEQDGSRLCVTSESIRDASKEVSGQILRLYKQFAVFSRLKRIANDGGKTELTSFRGSDISADDVVFEVENETAENAATRLETISGLYKLGLFCGADGNVSAEAKKKLLETLGFGNLGTAQSGEEKN
jgi:hypothetical protein